MAKLPRRRTRVVAIALAAAVAWLSAPAGAGEVGRDAVDLIGTWHVLVHYTDDHSHDPEQMRWDDKVWIFERSESRLRWTEYPIVVFEDKTGRFENLGGVRAARVLHGWEPNEAQSAQIRSGLEVNDRGSKSKTLRVHGDGWCSVTRPTAASAMIITYVENWCIEDATGKPVFRREDVLGSGRAENLEGLTEYVTTEVSADGDVLRGTFERDGVRHGTFRLMRAGATRGVEGSGKSNSQRVYEMFFGEEFGAAIMGGEGALREAVERRREEGGQVPDETREQVRAEIRARVEKWVRDNGSNPREYKLEVDSLTRKIEREVFDEGRSLEEVEQRLRDGKIKP
jgi:hypothetical protein